jgi:hypothetical protein
LCFPKREKIGFAEAAANKPKGEKEKMQTILAVILRRSPFSSLCMSMFATKFHKRLW